MPDTIEQPVPSTLSIADIAAASDTFEQAGLLSNTPLVALGDTLADHPHANWFESVLISGSVRNFTLLNVVLDATTLMLFQNRLVILDSIYQVPQNDDGRRPEQALATPLRDDEVLIIGYNNAHAGYRAWLTQCLPAIDFALRKARTQDVRLLLPDLAPWQAAFLALLGYADIPRLTVEPGRLYLLPCVEFSDFLNGAAEHGVSLSVIETIRRIRDAVPSQPSSARVLYVRNPAQRIRNEDAVIALLSEFGATIVEPDMLTAAERINLFRNANVVMGPTGPGLTDVAFCQPNALLWEWLERTDRPPVYNRLAQAAEVDYWGDLFEAGADGWTVDLAILVHRLTEAATRSTGSSASTRTVAPIDDLLRRFEPLGDSTAFAQVLSDAGQAPRRPPARGLDELLGLLASGATLELDGGGKIGVWMSAATTRREDLYPLRDALRRRGPTALLWVVESDALHPPGTMEALDRDFFKGYVAKQHPGSWFELCWRADQMQRNPRPPATSGNTTPVVLADIAVATQYIERERIFHGRSVTALSESLATFEPGQIFRTIGTTLTVRNYTLRNVVLDGTTLLLSQNRRIIAETTYFVPAPSVYHRDERLSRPIDDDEVLIVGYNTQHWGYQHWLTQCLPAIDWSVRQERTRPVRLLLPDLLPWQAESLRLLGHQDIPRFTPRPGEVYALPNAEYAEFLCGMTSFGASMALMQTMQRLTAAVPQAAIGTGKVLYIRTRPSYGAIDNEAAAIAILRQRGVMIVEPDQLGMADRIALFRAADAVIGPAGPALCDVVFCHPGALLWEWMPRHYLNQSINCLAQSAGVDYWGDLFETTGDDDCWTVDTDLLSQRLDELWDRLHAAPSAAAPVKAAVGSPSLDKLMLRFESLGDNCEFGAVQRAGGAEPLGLLRHNGIKGTLEERLPKLIHALERRFDGLGEPGSYDIVRNNTEWFVHDRIYDLWYHSGVLVKNADPDDLAVKETIRLKFLRRKLLEDLETGDKICVWKSPVTTTQEQVQPLLDVLRRFGPNTLLWVTLADDDHPPGTVEELGLDFLRGYITLFTDWDMDPDGLYDSWFEVLWRVDALRPPKPEDSGPAVTTHPNVPILLPNRRAHTPMAQTPATPTPATIARSARAVFGAPLPVTQAATATTTIELARIFAGRSAISLGDALRRHPNGVAFLPQPSTVTLRNYILEDVVLDADTLRLLKQDRLIAETAYFAPDTLPARDVIAAPVGEDEILVIGYNTQHWGYQHWLIQCLPAIDWSLRQSRHGPVQLVLPDLLPWQEETLRLLGHDRIPRFVPRGGERYRLRHAEYCDFLYGVSTFGISRTMLQTMQRLADAVPDMPAADTVLFIPNNTPFFGTLRNLPDAIALLQRRGVTVVDPETMSVADRIALFRNAEVIIGPHGPNLSNIVFCKPGTLLWEWLPAHHVNHASACLAQTAQVDYWGDLFETTEDGWRVDLAVVTQRLAELSSRFALRAAAEPAAPAGTPVRPPVDRLMQRFESLGDNCEFGLAQRAAGVEPLGLLRFTDIRLPAEQRLPKLAEALAARFEHLGAPGTIRIVADAGELIARDSNYQFCYHTGLPAETADPAAQAERSAARLLFLRRKLLEDLESGAKIFVWKCSATTQRTQVQPLMDVLRRLGPNTLLWVTVADNDHKAGTVETLEPDFFKGYVTRLAPDDLATDLDAESWFEVCWQADRLRPPPEEDAAQEKPSETSALAALARNPAITAPTPVSRPATKESSFARLFEWFRGR